MTTKIEWTDVTWNVLVGCSRVSAGCERCYAERVAHRGMSPQHRGLTVLGKKGPRWTGEVRFLPERLSEPLRWRKPRRVFVNSMSDLFHEGISHAQRAAICGAMLLAPAHTYQVLTKRPSVALDFVRWLTNEAARSCISPTALMGCAYFSALGMVMGPAEHERVHRLEGRDQFPWWLGVSVEDQRTADERVPLLLNTPAAGRWVSYEPALGPVDFTRTPAPPGWLPINGATMDDLRGCLPRWQADGCRLSGGLDWIVIGGESGPGARPFDLAWARSTIEQCREAGVPVFVKQLGAGEGLRGTARYVTDSARAEHYPIRDRKGGDMEEWPEDLRVRELPEVRRG